MLVHNFFSIKNVKEQAVIIGVNQHNTKELVCLIDIAPCFELSLDRALSRFSHRKSRKPFQT